MSYTFGKTAKTYDAMGFDTGTLAFDFLDRRLEERGVSVESLLDLACGTGTFALLCASLRKWTVYGLDSSIHMLNVARQKAEISKIPVRFVRADMRSFRFKRRFDVITCWSGSLNYVRSLADFRAVLRRAAKSLRPNGIFVFDVNTRREYVRQDGMFHSTRGDEFVEMRNHHLDKKTGLFHTRITTFVKVSGGKYECIEEDQVERSFSLKDVQRVLAGLRYKETVFYGDFGGRSLGKNARSFICLAKR